MQEIFEDEYVCASGLNIYREGYDSSHETKLVAIIFTKGGVINIFILDSDMVFC